MSIGRHVSKLSGYAPALPTPFRENGAIDHPGFERFCALQVAHGATALVVGGTTGESPTLSSDEHCALIRAAVSVAEGRVPVIAGTGSNSTAHAIELTRLAEAAGADAALSVVPYYNKPTQAGLFAHFSAIAAASGLPIILYDVPTRTVCGLTDETVARLAELPRFIGLKDAAGDITRPARLRPRLPGCFRLLSGDDATAPAYIAQGGDGCISVASNLVPGLCRSLFVALKQGQAARAHRLAQPLAHIADVLFRETSPAPLKQALSLLGLMRPALRLPLVEPAVATKAEISALVSQLSETYPEHLVGHIGTTQRSRVLPDYSVSPHA